jgi:hypothetical protein
MKRDTYTGLLAPAVAIIGGVLLIVSWVLGLWR